MKNGDANDNFNVIHVDALKASLRVLNKAIETGNDMLLEHSEVLKKDEGGGYVVVESRSQGEKYIDVEGNERVSGGAPASGDIKIHSHSIATITDQTTKRTAYSDALEPSECLPDTEGKERGDKCSDPNYELNIIVGRNGAPLPPTQSSSGIVVGPPDTRPLMINVFGRDSKLKFSISHKTATTILGQKNQRAKQKFLETQKSKKESNEKK